MCGSSSNNYKCYSVSLLFYYTFKVNILQPMRHRKGSIEKTLQSRPLASAVLGLFSFSFDTEAEHEHFCSIVH